MAQGIKSNISKETLEEMMKEFTIVEIAEKLNVSKSTIQRYKTKYSLKTDLNIALQKNITEHTKYSCDIHYFDKIDTYDKAYLLGFLCADGFVTERNEIGIGLQKSDLDMIKFFQEQLQSNKLIKEKNNGYELRLQNKNLCDKLKEIGIIPNKSLVLDIKQIITNAKLTDGQIKAFLLGYFDGDGGIYLYNPNNTTYLWSMSITGTLETCMYYKNYFNSGFLTKRHNDDKNNYTLQIGGCHKVEEALSKLYEIKNELKFCYDRKYQKYKNLIEYNRRK